MFTVLESSQWPEVGLFAGMTFHLGNFDECLMITNAYGMKGQYCLVEGTYNLLDEDVIKPEVPIEWPDNELSTWSALQMVTKNSSMR